MPWRSSSGAETSNRPMNGARCAIATPAGVFRSRSIDHGTGKDFLCPGHAGRTADAADGGGHALTLAARHGGAAGAADMPDMPDGPPGADDGLTAWAALTALAALTAATALTQGGRPQRLVGETGRLDGWAGLKAAQPPGLGAGWGHVLGRLQNAQSRRAAGIGAFDAVAGAPGQPEPSAPSNPSRSEE